MNLSRRLFLYFLITPLTINAILILSSTSWRETVAFESFIFAHRAANVFLERPVLQGADSWYPMIEAHEYLESGNQEKLVYDKIFFEDKIKFQYPPSSLLFLHFLKMTPIPWLFPDLTRVFDFISWVMVLAVSLLIPYIFHLSLHDTRAPCQAECILISGLLVSFCLTFYPLMKGLSLGQVQTWINFLSVVMFLSWMKRKERLAGILAGMISLIKPHYLLFFVWALLRRKTKFLYPFLITVIAGLLLSFWIFGIRNNLNYLQVLTFLSNHGESYYANQSVNGLLNRFFENGEIVSFQKQAYPPFHPWVFAGTMLGSLSLIAVTLLKGSESKGNVLDFSLVLLTTTLAAPIAWEHHYGILLPIYAYLVPYLLRSAREMRLQNGILLSYLLTSNFFAFTQHFSNSPLNLLQSYLFAGALIVFVILYTLRNRSSINSSAPKK